LRKFNASAYNVMKDNELYSMYNAFRLGWAADHNLIKNNKVYLTSCGIYMNDDEYNTVIGNTLINNTTGIEATNSAHYNMIYNNTVDTSSNIGILVTGSTDVVVKNNIITNAGTGLSDTGTNTTIDYNLFFGNTANGSIGTNSVTGLDPAFVSTDTANPNFMYPAGAVDNPALGAGCKLFDGTAQTETNIGARLEYVKNVTDAREFSFLTQAHDDGTFSGSDTITTYAIDIVSDAIGGNITTVGPYYVKFDVSATTMTANNQHEGMYVYITAGANKGKLYLIVDSVNDTTDTLTIYKEDTSGLNVDDAFIIVDRRYTHYSASDGHLHATKDGSPGNPVTWNTSGTVIIDGENFRSNGLYLNNGDYLIFDGFIITNTTGSAVYYFGANDGEFINGTIAYNSGGIYLVRIDSGTFADKNVFRGNEIFNNVRGIRNSTYAYSMYVVDNIIYNHSDGIMVDEVSTRSKVTVLPVVIVTF